MSKDPRSRKLVVYTDADQLAGAEQSLATLLAHLPPEIEVTVVGSHPPVVEAIVGERPAADVCHVPRVRTKADLHHALRVRRTLAELRPDVIHLNKTEVADLRYVELLAQTIGGLRIVSVVHHVEPVATGPARAIVGWLAARRPAIVAVSDALARQLETLLGVPSGTVHTVTNALPLRTTPPRPHSERFVVGALARFVRHKALDDLISAVAATEEARLLLGGDGPERGRLERLAWRLGVANRVTFLGWVEPDEVLEHCDLVASAARIEGHPLTLLDARRRGLPIVATDVGGVSEIVEHGVTGLLVPPGHVTGLAMAISQLSRSPERRAAMGRAAAAAAAADADAAAMADAYCQLYWPDRATALHDRSPQVTIEPWLRTSRGGR